MADNDVSIESQDEVHAPVPRMAADGNTTGKTNIQGSGETHIEA